MYHYFAVVMLAFLVGLLLGSYIAMALVRTTLPQAYLRRIEQTCNLCARRPELACPCADLLDEKDYTFDTYEDDNIDDNEVLNEQCTLCGDRLHFPGVAFGYADYPCIFEHPGSSNFAHLAIQPSPHSSTRYHEQ